MAKKKTNVVRFPFEAKQAETAQARNDEAMARVLKRAERHLKKVATQFDTFAVEHKLSHMDVLVIAARVIDKVSHDFGVPAELVLHAMHCAECSVRLFSNREMLKEKCQ